MISFIKRKLCLFVNYSDIQCHMLFVVCSCASGNSGFLGRWKRRTNFLCSSYPSNKTTQICKNVKLQVYQSVKTPKNPSIVIEMCFVKKITIFFFIIYINLCIKLFYFLGANCLRLLMSNPFHAGFYFTHLYSFYVTHTHIYIYIYIYIYMCVCVCVCAFALEMTPLNIMENENC